MDAPLLFQHSKVAYDAMKASAKPGPEGTLVWEGSLVNFISEHIEKGQSKYSYIMRALKAMGCVVQLRRGANKVPSQWALLRDPDLEVFNDKLGGEQYSYYGNRNKWEDKQKDQQIGDLNKRVTNLEDMVAAMLKGSGMLDDDEEGAA